MIQTSDTPYLPSRVLAEQTQISMPSYPHWIEPAVEFLRQKAVFSGACDETRSGKLMVALHEALSNAIVHGNLEVSSELKEQGDNAFAEALAERIAEPAFSDRSVEILVDSNLERCRWVITDQGQGFDLDAVMRKKQSDDPEVMLASGRGMLIMSTFLDDVRYELGGRRVVLSLQRDSGKEKRVSPRLPVREPVRIAPILMDGSIDWDAAYEAVSCDLSEQGIALFQDRLATTDRILIGVYVNQRMVYVPAEVRHCRTLSGDMVELGCRFQPRATASPPATSESSDSAALDAVIKDFLAKHGSSRLPANERRLHHRVVYNEKIEIVTSAHEYPVVGYARDLSKGGIAFITTVPLPAEVMLVMLPRAGAHSLKLRSRIVRCVMIQEGFFDVGAKFLGIDS